MRLRNMILVVVNFNYEVPRKIVQIIIHTTEINGLAAPTFYVVIIPGYLYTDDLQLGPP